MGHSLFNLAYWRGKAVTARSALGARYSELRILASEGPIALEASLWLTHARVDTGLGVSVTNRAVLPVTLPGRTEALPGCHVAGPFEEPFPQWRRSTAAPLTFRERRWGGLPLEDTSCGRVFRNIE